MGDGTAAMGKKSGGSKLIKKCRRCGKKSYKVRKKKCSSCGFGKTSKLRRYNWQTKRNGKTNRRK